MESSYLQRKRESIERAREVSGRNNIGRSPVQSSPVQSIEVSARRVINRNRLDISFSDIPSPDDRSALKERGWRYNGEGAYWYHADTVDNRTFIEGRFNLKLISPEASPEASPEVSPEVSPEDVTPYGVYKRQIDELIEHLKIGPADLQIRAIGALHKEIFSRDS